MAIKFLVAEKRADRFYFSVHMDDTKALEDGSPDAEYVTEYSWGLAPPEGVTETEYVESIKREIGWLVDAKLAAANPPAQLPGF